jgi:hypothetical protein
MLSCGTGDGNRRRGGVSATSASISESVIRLVDAVDGVDDGDNMPEAYDRAITASNDVIGEVATSRTDDGGIGDVAASRRDVCCGRKTGGPTSKSINAGIRRLFGTVPVFSQETVFRQNSLIPRVFLVTGFLASWPMSFG